MTEVQFSRIFDCIMYFSSPNNSLSVLYVSRTHWAAAKPHSIREKMSSFWRDGACSSFWLFFKVLWGKMKVGELGFKVLKKELPSVELWVMKFKICGLNSAILTLGNVQVLYVQKDRNQYNYTVYFLYSAVMWLLVHQRQLPFNPNPTLILIPNPNSNPTRTLLMAFVATFWSCLKKIPKTDGHPSAL